MGNNTKDEEITALRETLPKIIESGLAILQTINISIGGKNGLSGIKQNKKLDPVVQIHFMWLYISIAFSSQTITRILLLAHSMVVDGTIT